MLIDNAPRRIWHVGFIVDRLEDAMGELSAALGLSWAPVHQLTGQALEAPGGVTFPLDTRVVFALDLPLSIELIEPTPGTPNVRRGDSAFHHLGYWARDLAATDDYLSGLGMPCVAFRMDDSSGKRRIMLNEGPYGVLLEATNVLTARPGLEHFYPAEAAR